MPNPGKPGRQDMHVEAFKEFGAFHRGDHLLVVLMIIAPGECDLFVIHLQDPVIRDGYPVSISS